MTKICITATGASLDAQIDPRFGRCQYFIVVDPETMEFNAIPNDAAAASGGAGIRAAQTVASFNVDAVITGSVGPNAFPALQSSGIKILTGATGTVRDAATRYKQGELSELTNPGQAYHGMGGGMGGQFGRGGGRHGRGGGRGRRGGW